MLTVTIQLLVIAYIYHRFTEPSQLTSQLFPRLLADPVAPHGAPVPGVARLMAEAALPLPLLPASVSAAPRSLPLDSAPCTSTPHIAETGDASPPVSSVHLIRPLEVVALLVTRPGAHIELPTLVDSFLLDCFPG